MKKTKTDLKRFIPLFLLVFTNGLSFTMLFPVLPYVIKLYDQTEIILGLLLATFSLFQFFASPILGALSDKYGRKKILIITHIGTIISWIILGISYFLPNIQIFGFILLPMLLIFFSRVFDGFTGGNNSVAQAMVADLTTHEERPRIFGINGAVMGVALMIGPALGSMSLGFGLGYAGTAILGGSIATITLFVMIFMIKESLPVEKRNYDLEISFKKLNIISGIKKWKGNEMIRYLLIIKILFFIGFVGYTSIIGLYLMDIFGFAADKVGYYIMFTGSFLIFHQSITINFFTKKLGDRKSLITGLLIMGLAFLAKGLSPNIYIFTIAYFFSVMGISLCFTNIGVLLTRAVGEKNQGEVMGLGTSVDSFISIFAPLFITILYSMVNFSIFLIIAIFPLIAVMISKIYFKNIFDIQLEAK